MSFQLYGLSASQKFGVADRTYLAFFAAALCCVMGSLAWHLTGPTRFRVRVPPQTVLTRTQVALAPREVPIISLPPVGSKGAQLAMRAITSATSKRLFVNLWGEIGLGDGERLRVDRAIPAVWVSFDARDISSFGGSVAAALNIGEQVRALRQRYARTIARRRWRTALCISAS